MQRAGLSTDTVVRAGAALADEVGFAHATPSELARRLGVRVASLYSHVANADDLRARIALLALDEVADRTSEALAGRAGREALVALGDAYRDYARTHPGRYDAMRHPLSPDAAASSAGPRIAALTVAALRGYGLSPLDETHAVRLLGSTFHGFISLELAGGFSHSAPPSQQSWERILDGLDRTLRAWSTTPTPEGTR
ncbi:TetR-like C-terminal domain-containing protein [Nocardioides sp. YIM 152588]|uniref:TetR/AcrR family transcriptional regulator n=1 Tax=Nocardioides sp. YIM 152588 TaxID=3158259 RepID=UPI0032E4F244